MRSLGQLVDEARKRKGWGYNRLSVELGILDGKILNATQVRRLLAGERQNLPREWVERLIDVLDLDEYEVWEAAGLLPPDVTAEGLRLLRQLEHLDDDAATAAVARHRKRHAISRKIRPVQAAESSAMQRSRTKSD